ncbi:MAG: phosphoenolpyruvate--protein phosphotransferase [Treponema sp.]|nr:phosphoenolpyruvate--protein phosphotransferase [Treponema sp.]
MNKLTGIPASPGFAAGKAYIYTDNDFPEMPHYTLGKNQLEAEMKRLEDAYEAAEAELQIIYEKALQETGEQADIISAHIMMLQDPEIREQVRAQIENSLENAEWVIREIYGSLAQTMIDSGDPLFRERVTDINDVSKRLLNQLLHIHKNSLSEIDRDVILVAADLSPAEILTMNRNRVKGLVIGQGGRTSHIAILARAFNIPAVLGVTAAVAEISNDDELAEDGSSGIVLVNPDQNELEKYNSINIQNIKFKAELDKLKGLPAETKDGRRVELKANIEVPEEAGTVAGYGASGIGLYRSEFLFMSSGGNAGEEQQLEAYSRVLKVMGDLPVTIRTVDIGGDKILPEFENSNEKNPLLGWRAIRFSLSKPQMFKIQLRALLRASVNGNVKIMFPLISGIEELEQALDLLEEAKSECKMKGQGFAENINTGIMIEVPSAVMTADILAEKSDFFSIGTNDLIQYTLALDRGNEKLDYLARPLHPAVIRSIKMTIDAAHGKGIKAAMCGEIAGDPAMTAVLLGLDLDEFSMNAPSIPKVKKIIRDLSVTECKALADEILSGKGAEANTALVDKWVKDRFKFIPELIL